MDPGCKNSQSIQPLGLKTCCSLNKCFELVRIRDRHLLKSFVHVLNKLHGSLTTLTNMIQAGFGRALVICYSGIQPSCRESSQYPLPSQAGWLWCTTFQRPESRQYLFTRLTPCNHLVQSVDTVELQGLWRIIEQHGVGVGEVSQQRIVILTLNVSHFLPNHTNSDESYTNCTIVIIIFAITIMGWLIKIWKKGTNFRPCLVLSAARSSRLNQEAFCLIDASAWKWCDDETMMKREESLWRNHLKYHCNARCVSYVFELLDVCPDVVALVLVLGGHHQCKRRVNVCHSECPGLLVNLWDVDLNNVETVWCEVAPANRWNLPTPKTALVLSSGPAYSSRVSFPLAVCSTTLITYLMVVVIDKWIRILLCQSVLVGVSPILALRVTLD